MYTFENINICHKTDIGLKRKTNEDSYLLIDPRKNPQSTWGNVMIFAIADGLGGHSAGEVASKMACKELLEYFTGNSEPIKDLYSPKSVLNYLEKGFWKIHKKIKKRGEENKSYAGMATTLSVLVLVRSKALIAHVGDSRIYRLRDNVLEQLTEDDTMAQLSVEMGYLEPEESATHPLRHALIQAMGQDLDEVHTGIEKVKTDDIFLLCSDGLHNMITDDEMREILLCNPVRPSACDALIDAALEKGGNDNVTVIVAKI